MQRYETVIGPPLTLTREMKRWYQSTPYEEIPDKLINDPERFPEFILQSIQDYRWVKSHNTLIQKLCTNLTKQAMEGQIPPTTLFKIARLTATLNPSQADSLVEYDLVIRNEREKVEGSDVPIEKIILVSRMALLQYGEEDSKLLFDLFSFWEKNGENFLSPIPLENRKPVDLKIKYITRRNFAPLIGFDFIEPFYEFLATGTTEPLQKLDEAQLFLCIKQCHLWNMKTPLLRLQKWLLFCIQDENSATKWTDRSREYGLAMVMDHCINILENKFPAKPQTTLKHQWPIIEPFN